LAAGVEDVKKGGKAPGTMSSAESDKYIQNQRKLKYAGVDIHITTEDELVSVAGIPVTPGPRVILCPGFAITQREIMDKIDEGNRISKRSSLVLEGEGLRVKNLDLDGALVIRTGHDCDVTVDGLVVRNKGYEIVEVGEGEDVPEEVAIRGYTMTKHEVMEIIINEPGKYHIGPDGEIKRV
jgi:UDP-sugar pyrophosphorylase